MWKKMHTKKQTLSATSKITQIQHITMSGNKIFITVYHLTPYIERSF